MTTRPIPIAIPATVATYDLTTTAPSTISCLAIEVIGLVGSMTPQVKFDTDTATPATTSTYQNTPYYNMTTATAATAGTAITADGLYEIPTDGLVVGMNVTAVTNPFTILVRQLAGPAAGSGASGSGGGGEVTIADGADVAMGETADTPVTDPSDPGTAIALLKGLLQSLTIPSAATFDQVALNSATDTLIVAANPTRRGLVISNPDAANAIYLGPSGVTAADGFYLAPLQSVPLGLVSGAIYGISSAGTPSATYVEV